VDDFTIEISLSSQSKEFSCIADYQIRPKFR